MGLTWPLRKVLGRVLHAVSNDVDALARRIERPIRVAEAREYLRALAETMEENR